MLPMIPASAALLGKLATALPAIVPTVAKVVEQVATNPASRQLLAATGGGAKLQRKLEQQFSAQGVAGKIVGALPLVADGLKLLGDTFAAVLGAPFSQYLRSGEREVAATHAKELAAPEPSKKSVQLAGEFLELLQNRVAEKAQAAASQQADGGQSGHSAQDLDSLKEHFEYLKRGREIALSLI